MTTTAVTTSTDFQARLYEKIRADIGSLMTDKELKQLVATAMQKTFFEERVERDRWGSETKKRPAELVEIVRELIAPRMEKALKEWLVENDQAVKEALDKALAGGLASAVLRSFDSMLQQNFFTLQNNLQQTLGEALQRR